MYIFIWGIAPPLSKRESPYPPLGGFSGEAGLRTCGASFTSEMPVGPQDYPTLNPKGIERTGRSPDSPFFQEGVYPPLYPKGVKGLYYPTLNPKGIERTGRSPDSPFFQGLYSALRAEGILYLFKLTIY